MKSLNDGASKSVTKSNFYTQHKPTNVQYNNEIIPHHTEYVKMKVMKK